MWLLWEGGPGWAQAFLVGTLPQPLTEAVNLPTNAACLGEPERQGTEATCSPDSSLVMRGACLALPGRWLFSGEGTDPVSRPLVIKEASRQKALTAY